MSMKYLGVRQMKTIEIKSVYPIVKKKKPIKYKPLYAKMRNRRTKFLGFSGKSLVEMHACPSCPCEG